MLQNFSYNWYLFFLKSVEQIKGNDATIQIESFSLLFASIKENAVWINWVFVQTNNFVISSDDDDPHLSEEHDPQSSRWMKGICKESLLP